MRFLALGVSMTVAAGAAVWAQTARTTEGPGPETARAAGSIEASVSDALDRGARWLVSVQGEDGGWGQDGGHGASIRAGERLESSGNDVANTAVAALALLQAGDEYEPNVERALAFILRHVEASPTEGLAITDRRQTQIQRKLGPYIDTFLTSRLLVAMDGRSSKPAQNARIREALEKTVAKIEKHQLADGSWNHAGGWAPVLGTSMASRSLYEAQQKGVAVADVALERAHVYTLNALAGPSPTARALTDGVALGAAEISTGSGAGIGTGTGVGIAAGAVAPTALAPAAPVSAPAEAAGVALYQRAQALEQLSRTAEGRAVNALQIAAIESELGDARVVQGFGSMGGEEFFSYLNISDSLKRTGGESWSRWHADVTQRILKLQNTDGTWAGHHCITGRVAMTSAAILNLTIDRAD